MSVQDVLSIQLYTLRNLGSLDAVLDATASAGYTYVEMIGAHLANPRATRTALDARGLKGSSSHVAMSQLRDEPDAMIEACGVLGINELYMPAVPGEERQMPAAGWRALGHELGSIADRLAKADIRLGYHNHDWELAPKEGDATALDLVFEAAGASPLNWQADLAWIVRGGGDPKAWMTKLRSRLTAVHVKDIAPAGSNLDEDGWSDVGAGVLDWPDLWQAARAAGAGWMVVEHDKPADPAACVRNSYAYLTSMKV